MRLITLYIFGSIINLLKIKTVRVGIKSLEGFPGLEKYSYITSRGKRSTKFKLDFIKDFSSYDSKINRGLFLEQASEVGNFVSHLQLQKLVYYAQAWSLAIRNEELFSEDFEAWIHGPFLPSLYADFAKHKWKPIEPPQNRNKLSDELEQFLSEVFHVFGKYTGYELELMTHQERPWQEARGDIPADQASTEKIQKKSMKVFCFNLTKNNEG